VSGELHAGDLVRFQGYRRIWTVETYDASLGVASLVRGPRDRDRKQYRAAAFAEELVRVTGDGRLSRNRRAGS
jgi:hypothetical protein